MSGLAALQPWSEAVRAGASRERMEFLESHVGLVRFLALRIASRLPASVDLDDLVHDGIVGLLDATEKFDPARGVRFRTYAESRVRGAILDGLRRRDWRPRSVRRAQRELDEAVGRASSHAGGAAGEDEIAEEMGVDLDRYRELLQEAAAGPLLSLEDLTSGAEPGGFAEERGPEASLARRELMDLLVEEIRVLPERERRVLELYYHEEPNMKEVGEILGVTESRVCQLHSQAASRLRSALERRLHVSRRAPAAAAAATATAVRARRAR